MTESSVGNRSEIGRGRVLRASAWRSGGYLFIKALQVASNIVLARLLAPTAFGLLALSDVFLRGLRMFSEIGVGPAIIQSSHWREQKFLNTAWTLQVIRGLAIWLVAASIAYPVSVLYNERALAFLLPAMGMVAAIRGLNSTAFFTLSRQLREKQLVALMMAERLVARGAAITIALVWPTVWAIVAGAVLGGVFECLASHRFLPGHRHRLGVDRKALRAIGSFGIWVFVGTVIVFFGQQIDRLLLGKLDSLGMLGVYSIALSVAHLPKEATSQLFRPIFFPVLADAVHSDTQSFRRRLNKLRSLILPGGIVCVLAVVFASPWFFTFLYDDRYHDAAWIAPLASIGVWFGILNGSVHHTLMALGATRPLAASGAVKLVVGTLGCVVGFQLFGLPGFLLGIALGEVGQHLYDSCVLASRSVNLFWQDAGYTLVCLAAAVVGVAVLPPRAVGIAGEPFPYLGVAVQASLLAVTAVWVALRLHRNLRGKGPFQPARG